MSGTLDSRQPGDKLSAEESLELGRLIGELLRASAQARPAGPASKETLSGQIASFLSQVGYSVRRDAAYPYLGRLDKPVVFDLTASLNGENLYVQALSELSLDALESLKDALQVLDASGERASLCIGADLLQQPAMLSGPTGEAVAVLMKDHNVGAILADRDCILICESHAQLRLEEMPTFWTPEAAP